MWNDRHASRRDISAMIYDDDLVTTNGATPKHSKKVNLAAI